VQPYLQTCEAWTTPDAVRGTDEDCAPCQGVTADTPSDYVIETAIAQAQDYLFGMSGFQFTGECEGTARPCSTDEEWGGMWAWAPIPFVLPDGVWPFWGAGCGCGGGCGCCGPTAFHLGRVPIVSITEVKLDGVELTEDVDWALVDNLLVRLNPDNPTEPAYWPSCQNIAAPDTETGTMSVAFTWGATVPPLGVLAARDLACVLVRAECGDDSCRPAQNMTQKVAGGTTVQLMPPTESVLRSLPKSVQMFLELYGPPLKRFPKLRRPKAGQGWIWNTPVSAGGYGRVGSIFGAGCQGCS
jgi:hypothetical protein